MEWFQGGIADAVTQSRRNGLIFVVFVDGHDEAAKQLLELINTKEVSQNLLKSSHFVAIKVDVNTLPHQQFCEIYKEATSSSIFFIGKTGVPLEIIRNARDVTEIFTLVNSAIVKDGGKPLEMPSTGPEHHESIVEKKVEEEPQINENTVEMKEINEEPCEEGCSNTEKPNLSNEDKLKLAQEIIEKKREQKKQEDEEKEKQKEIERRRVGQDMQKLKRWQQDQELKQLIEERQKAKREEQEAREKVKRQIEEDKREKAARQQAAALSAQSSSNVEPPKTVRTAKSDVARLQFRLPDGSSHTHEFPSTVLLQEVLNFITANLNLTFSNFVLSTTFPRREFSSSDYSLSLLDLQLVPNAVILILPKSHGGAVTTNASPGVMGMVWYVLAPLFNFLTYIKGLLFGHGPAQPNNEPSSNTAKRLSQEDPVEGTSKSMPKRRAGESVVRRYGNIHRLKDRDSDDENNTWNGNSTQQM